MFTLLLIIFFSSEATSIMLRECEHDVFLNSEELIQDRGYKLEKHSVTTKDEYILTLQRIVNPKLSLNKQKKVVFLQHGLMTSSVCFLNCSPGGGLVYTTEHNSTRVSIGNNLGFVLADLGYDVWLGNSRGNSYSPNHTYLDPKKDRNYWAFTYDEMIQFDLPASIEHVLDTTNQSTLAYIGHSQGALIMFGLLSLQPEYESKIKPFIALAPVTTGRHALTVWNLFNSLAIIKPAPGPVFERLPVFKRRYDKRCTFKLSMLKGIPLTTVVGLDLHGTNYSRLPVYFAGAPDSTSVWNIFHYLQGAYNDRFAFYDFGRKLNLKKYSSPTPPVYPLKAIRSRNIILYRADADILSVKKDMENLKKILTVPLLRDYVVPRKGFNHVSFVYSNDVGPLVNSEIVSDLERYT